MPAEQQKSLETQYSQLSLFGRKRVSGQRNKAESKAFNFKIESYITPDLCWHKEYGLLFVHDQLFRSSECPMITLAFMKSKLAYSVGSLIETLSKIFQHPVSEEISGVSYDELLSKSLILCAKQKVLVHRQNVYMICSFI